MVNRIKLLLSAKNLTARQFAEEIGVQPSGMSHILSGRNNPSLDFILKVVNRYPEIDINWLLHGRGEMYVLNGGGVVQQPAKTASMEKPPVEQPVVKPAPIVPQTHSVVPDTSSTPSPVMETVSPTPSAVMPAEEYDLFSNIDEPVQRQTIVDDVELVVPMPVDVMAEPEAEEKRLTPHPVVQPAKHQEPEAEQAQPVATQGDENHISATVKAVGHEKTALVKSGDTNRKIKKFLVFYSDNTYEEFVPSRQ